MNRSHGCSQRVLLDATRLLAQAAAKLSHSPMCHELAIAAPDALRTASSSMNGSMPCQIPASASQEHQMGLLALSTEAARTVNQDPGGLRSTPEPSKPKAAR